MKTRTSLESTKDNTSKTGNDFKRKYHKKVKIKSNSNQVSYCDTHNIGKRKSNSSVVTYSLNSHLFFDVYAKFDNNNVPRSNGMGKNAYRSQSSIFDKTIANVANLQSPVSDDISTEAMSNYECPSNKSSPKRLNILCEAEPVNRDESLIPSPQMARILPFRSPHQTRLPRSIYLQNSSSDVDCHSNDKEIPQTNTETFHRILENKTVFKKHLSTVNSLAKNVSKTNLKQRSSNRLCKEELPEPLVSSNDNKELQPLRQRRMASLNAAAIINCVQSPFNNRRKRLRAENVEISLELDVCEEMVKTESTVKRRVGRPKKEFVLAAKIVEKENGFEVVKKKERASKGQRSSIRGVKEEREDVQGETLWHWDGEGEDRRMELEGGVVTRRCYGAIRHCRDEVVISAGDCVLLRTGDRGGRPYLAKITALYDDEDHDHGGVVRKMMTMVWYYRPEHTEQGRLWWHTEADVYASRHIDTNSVDCIDDKAFVLTAELYGRYLSYQRREETFTGYKSLFDRLLDVMHKKEEEELEEEEKRDTTNEPSIETFASDLYYDPNFLASFPASLSSSNVFVCRGFYDIKQHRVTRTFTASLSSPLRELPQPPLIVPSSTIALPLAPSSSAHDQCASLSISSFKSRLDHVPLISATTTSAVHLHSLQPLASSTDVILLLSEVDPHLSLSTSSTNTIVTLASSSIASSS